MAITAKTIIVSIKVKPLFDKIPVFLFPAKSAIFILLSGGTSVRTYWNHRRGITGNSSRNIYHYLLLNIPHIYY